jgi:hypothetical protein
MPGDVTAPSEGRQQQQHQVVGALMSLAALALPNSPTKAKFTNAYIKQLDNVFAQMFAENPGRFANFGTKREIIALFRLAMFLSFLAFLATKFAKHPDAPVAVEQLTCSDLEIRLWAKLPADAKQWIHLVRAICNTTPK